MSSIASAKLRRPCSLCGKRRYNRDCPRCEIRKEAERSDEGRIIFNQSEQRDLVDKGLDTVMSSLERATSTITVALVGCSKQKKPNPGDLPAHEIYAGRLAQMGYRLAKLNGWDVHFLSALHGVVPPSARIAPYDFNMSYHLPSERAAWGNRVVGELLAMYPLQPLSLVFLAGQAYIVPILDAIPELGSYWECLFPLDGLDLFERFAWYRAQLEFLRGVQ